MAQAAQERRIDQFFAGPGARADDWRSLVEAAKSWNAGQGDRAKFEESALPTLGSSKNFMPIRVRA